MSLLNDYPHLSRVQRLAAGRKLKVYLVGGFVRDRLLKRPTLDMDFAVEKNALALARSFARSVRGAFVLLDKKHGCGRVVRKEKGAVVTFDFADWRATTVRGDLGHRDFTINAMAVDLARLKEGMALRDVLYDPRKGERDLKDRRLRMVAPGVFREDPLRLLRAFSLRAQLGFTVERKTLGRIRRDAALLHTVSAERIREELFKILSSPRCAAVLRGMDRVGLLEQAVPQVAVMAGVPQGGYHHLDVWQHSLETVAQLDILLAQTGAHDGLAEYLREPIAGGHSRAALMRLAALLHDVGKPETRKKEAHRISFHGHEHVGRNIARNVAVLLKLSIRERHVLEDMVLFHLRPGYLSNFKVPSARAVFRYFRDTKEEGASIALLSLADQRSTRGPLTSEADQRHHEKICRSLVDRFFAKKDEKPRPRLITGDDLIRTLGLKPSALFGRILKEVEEKQALGKVSDLAGALELAKRIAKQSFAGQNVKILKKTSGRALKVK